MIAQFKILSMMGMGGLVGAMFGWGDAVGDVSDALGGVGELGGTKAKKVPLTEKEIELKAGAEPPAFWPTTARGCVPGDFAALPLRAATIGERAQC